MRSAEICRTVTCVPYSIAQIWAPGKYFGRNNFDGARSACICVSTLERQGGQVYNNIVLREEQTYGKDV